MRFDFEPAYEMIDQFGRILRILDSGLTNKAEKVEVATSESLSERQVEAIAINTERNLLQLISIRPDMAILEVVSHEGINLERLEANPEFSRTINVLTEIFELNNIKQIKRAGIRVFYLEKLSSEELVQNAFSEILDSKINSIISEHSGPIDDYGIQLDGGIENGRKFHIRFGPSSKEDSKKYFSKRESFDNPQIDCDFVIDMDVFENKFEIPDCRPRRWIKQSLEKPLHTMPKLRKLILSKIS